MGLAHAGENVASWLGVHNLGAWHRGPHADIIMYPKNAKIDGILIQHWCNLHAVLDGIQHLSWDIVTKFPIMDPSGGA